MNSVLQFSGDLSQRLSLDITFADSNNNSDKISIRGDKYSLRPRSLRRAHENEENTPAIQTTKTRVSKSKQKQKPAPLSKYRRKTANARERTRMREINQAFESLRKAIPHLQCNGIPNTASNEKLTKITTLRLAMKYISALSAVLREQSNSGQNNATSSINFSADLGDLLSDCSDLDCLFLESDGESLQLHSDLSDHSLTPADFVTDFTDNSPTSVDFPDNSFSPTFSDQSLSPFDTFFSDFS